MSKNNDTPFLFNDSTFTDEKLRQIEARSRRFLSGDFSLLIDYEHVELVEPSNDAPGEAEPRISRPAQLTMPDVIRGYVIIALFVLLFLFVIGEETIWLKPLTEMNGFQDEAALAYIIAMSIILACLLIPVLSRIVILLFFLSYFAFAYTIYLDIGFSRLVPHTGDEFAYFIGLFASGFLAFVIASIPWRILATIKMQRW